MLKFLSMFLEYLSKSKFNLPSHKSIWTTDEIQNGRSETGADIQWFFDTLDSSLKKTGDENWQLRYNKFLVLNGDLIHRAKRNYENRKKYNGEIICKNMSDLNDKENIRIILENINRMKGISKEFYDKMNEMLSDWFTKVLLYETPEERLPKSSLKDSENTEMQFLIINAKYYRFILDNEGSFTFNDDGAVPIKENVIEEYNELVSKMNESLKKHKKHRLFN